MKFCTECGSQLPLGQAKFCPNCGKSLWNVTESSDTLEEQKEVTVQSGQTAIYSLGVKLEQMVEQIIKNKGFSTERRIKLRGQSGSFNEIDVLAKRENDVLAVECKNYGEARLVGIKEIRDFQSKLQDLSQINHAMFVTNIKFTSEAAEYANHNHIELWDGEKLSRAFYLLNLGRLGPNESASPAVTVLDCALPIKTQYNEAAKLLLVNPHITIIETTLDLHPYYLFEYQADVKKGLLRRSSEVEYGWYIVDATNKKIIEGIENDTKYKKYAQSFFSKKEKQNQEEELEEILDQIEKTETIQDIKTIQWVSKYKIEHSSEYAINKLECKLPANAAERMTLEAVVREKNVEDDDVVIRKSSLIYVPKWLINIMSKETHYRREVLPASEKVIIDEIMFCPKEFYEKRPSNKKTYAVCEVCGCAYCNNHISLMNDAYYCERHTQRWTVKGIAMRRHPPKDTDLSISDIENSLGHSIDKALEKHL